MVGGFWDQLINRSFINKSHRHTGKQSLDTVFQICGMIFKWCFAEYDIKKFFAQHCGGSRTQPKSPSNLAWFWRGSKPWSRTMTAITFIRKYCRMININIYAVYMNIYTKYCNDILLNKIAHLVLFGCDFHIIVYFWILQRPGLRTEVS